MKILAKSLKHFATSPTRKPFKNLTKEDVNFFESFMKPHNVITDPHEL